MLEIRTVSDIDECHRLWQQIMPQEYISDLWEIRNCFHRRYRRPLHFVVAEEDGEIRGLIPLSWLEESQSYAYFPGEVWDDKTWLEQNRVYAADVGVLRRMLVHLSRSRARYHLRYLLPIDLMSTQRLTVDEVGYLFLPPRFDYDMDEYFRAFSHKSARRIQKEVAAFEARGAEVRYDVINDFDLMIRLNCERFGQSSYFQDARFVESFRDLRDILNQRGLLRMTTILIEGVPAAVDMGCLYRGVYTLLAGGTNGAFPGIAKMINLHHMQRACRERVNQVDFLCGDFSWKTMFHLTPRPLYMLSNLPCMAAPSVETRPTGIGVGLLPPVASVGNVG